MSEEENKSDARSLDHYVLSPLPIPSSTPEGGEWSARKRGRLTSVVWKDFEKREIDGIDYAFCKHCGKKYKSLSKNGTKGLHKHLLKCFKKINTDNNRPEILAHLKDARSDQIESSSLERGVTMQEDDAVESVHYESHVFKQKVAQQMLVSAIIMHELPLETVQLRGFQSFTASLQPLFKMPSQKEMENEVREIYEVKKMVFYKMLEEVKARIAVTVDFWKCDEKKNYVSIAAHFVDEAWTLQKCQLRFVHLPPPDNVENLWNQLTASLPGCKISQKISTIVIGSCSSNDEINMLNLDKLNCRLLLDGRLPPMLCGSHIFGLIVKDGLKLVEKEIEKIRDAVLFWTATSSREKTFLDVASQLRVPYEMKLCVDDVTYWDSTYLMVRGAIPYKNVFTKLKERDKLYALYTCAPSDEEWEFAKDVCESLKPFFRAAELFSGSKHVTANNYFPYICQIKEGLGKWITSSNDVIRQMAYSMFMKFDEFWKANHVVMAIAAFLDPRYKLKLVNFFFLIIYGSDAHREVERIRTICYDLFREYQSGFKSNLEVNGWDISELKDFDASDPLLKYDEYVQRECSTVDAITEIDQYIADPVLPRTRDFNILGWWRENGIKYPTLQLMARDFLAVPISTVTSKSAFGTVGRTVPSIRRKLRPETVECFMCAHDWLWNEMEGTSSTKGASYTSPIQYEMDEDFQDCSCQRS